MNEYIKIAEIDDKEYGLISEFIKDDKIIFAYTKVFNNKYTYEFVEEKVNDILMEKYLNGRSN